MITAILACHNRRSLTEQALQSLLASAEAAGVEVRVVLFDDGSTDGTADAVREIVPAAALEVITGDGSAFWARGMAAAERAALRTAGAEDHLLWLNDDVTLEHDAVTMLIEVLNGRTDRIVVGATVDPRTGEVNYGGYARAGAHPLRFRHLPVDGRARPAVTLNGNCVLVPVAAARAIGGIDGSFSHGLADIDYGLRANAAHVLPVVAPRPVGSCPSHDPVVRRPVLIEWAAFRSVKGGGHAPSMIRILRRAAPVRWPLFFAWSYAAWWVRAVSSRARRH